jgi:hypothetical protein
MKASVKELELREVIGKTVSCNWSPTLRAKLIKVNRKDCILQVEPTLYTKTTDLMKDVGKTFKMPIDYTWNAYFY